VPLVRFAQQTVASIEDELMIKLAVFGAIGYAAYRYLQKSQAASSRNAPEIALAGGPLSSHATLQHDPDLAPQRN
jgi:hypothetical protein